MNIKRPHIISKRSAVLLHQASVQSTISCNAKTMMASYTTSHVGISRQSACKWQ